MRHRYGIVIMTLIILVATSTAYAQHHPGKFGIGLTVNGSDPGFVFSIGVSPSFLLEPTFFAKLQNIDESNPRQFDPGMGLLYQFRQHGDLRPLVGVRFGLNILRNVLAIPVYYNPPYIYYSSERQTYVDVTVGPIFAARYFLSDNFAVSGEFQVIATFYDKGDLPAYHRNIGELSIATSQLLAAYFYF